MGFSDYKHLVVSTAARYGYDAVMLAAQAAQESAWNPLARSYAGAVGLMQFMPGTWGDWGKGKSRTDPAASLDAGVRYMQWLKENMADTATPTENALAAYNHGYTAMRKLMARVNRSDWPALAPHVPAETRDYVSKVMGKRTWYAVQLGGMTVPAMVGAVAVAGLLALFIFMRR